MNQQHYPVKKIAEILSAFAHLSSPGATIRTLSTDSRKLEDVENALFFALKGRRDGHQFIREVYDAGIRNFVVSAYDRDIERFPGANFLVVPDALGALQQLAAFHRQQFDIPVIAITGSNGKTIVKEWLYQLLAPGENIVRSPKSYNSQIGVPLSVWNMNSDHTLAIFEAGISKAGEMEALEAIIRPSVGILTTIGEAHNEGFASRSEKIGEKLKLFRNASLFVYNPGHLQGYDGPVPGEQQFTWSLAGPANLSVTDEEEMDAGEKTSLQFLRGRFNSTEVQSVVPFTDAASIENAVCCWATLLALGRDPQETDDRLGRLLPVKMRLEMKNGVNNCSVIDDSYSLDTSSLAIALDFLKQQNQHDKRTLVLSDIPESGLDPVQLYTSVAALLESKSVDRLIGIGPVIGAHRELFPPGSIFFDTVEELLESRELKFSGETVLLKGARSFRFERISRALTQKVHETVLEINLNALEHNLNHYKSLLAPGVKIMSIVKAFSYGSGSFEIANLLQFNKIDYLAVAYADEGVALRKAGVSLPVMVMNADESAFDIMIDHQLEPEIFSLEMLIRFLDTLQARAVAQYPVHIKLDTGMHRLGFMPGELPALLALLSASGAVIVRSVFSHLVSSEDPADDVFTDEQIRQFTEMTVLIEQALGYPFIRHIANTSAISRLKHAQFDMVRLGIGLYGLDSAQGKSSPLQTVAVLRTSISQIKELKAGDTVGYNRKGVLETDGKIATVKIGYADGYNRRLGNGAGQMEVNGQLVPTIGNICMDMCMLDITGKDAKVGDEVLVFGGQVGVADLAAQLGTIPYEILTGISQRVKRIYFYE